MKKLYVLLLGAVLTIGGLTSCGDATVQSTASPAPTPSATPAIVESDIREFALSADDFTASLNEALSNSGYAELTDPKSTPSENKEFGVHTAYTYSLGTGASLVLYVGDASGNILNFSVLTIASEVTADSLFNAQLIMGCLLGITAGDDAEAVSEELSLTEVDADTFATASAPGAEYLYMVQDGSIVFMISPA